ncbi:MAG: hypothetical protein KKC51_12005 [Verrucomicrobia bacterium]|nr:hypothetical protein [Verrucomicrobiota bacterium]
MEEKHIVVKCCRCRRVRQQDRWVGENEFTAVHPLYSHSYCPACMEQVHAEISTWPVAAAC